MVTIWFYFIRKENIEYLFKKNEIFELFFPKIDQLEDFVLYGYTTDKSIAEMWKEQRSSYFIEQEQCKDEDYYKNLKLSFPNLEISWIKIRNKRKTVKILSSYTEIEYVKTYWIDYILPKYPYLCFHPSFLYSLKDEYKEYLYKLGVGNLFQIDSDKYDLRILENVLVLDKKDFFYLISYPLQGKEINLFFHIFSKLLKE